ncbi:MAG: DUF3127 domain-containing protein [Rikenellaceae bacterium]|nr:DUF3127 domain-containing protein [Rikenellaceae bacterium]
MELDLVVYKLMDVVGGTSVRGQWQKRDVVFDMLDEYNTKLCVTFFGDKMNEVATLAPGDKVTVSFNIASREYNGRWFTEARGWRVRPVVESMPQQQSAPVSAMPPLEQSGEELTSSDGGDLPF